MKKQIFFLFLLFVSVLTLAQTQEPRLVLPIGHTSWVTSAVFSPDGKWVLTANKNPPRAKKPWKWIWG